MKIHIYQQYPNANPDKGLSVHSDSDKNVKTNSSTPQSHVAESGETKVSLSSEALTILDIDKKQSNKTFEQKEIEYRLAKQEYEKKVNNLPVDYRKMKQVKDRLAEEIKILKAEVSKIKQSNTLNKEEKEQEITALEQQIASKSLTVIEISEEFAQKLKEQERSKQISPESAADMLKTFHSSPPKAPEEKRL
ncbi:hypothetical protein [Motilimonas sp. E26]|uniref:hypothetical protein n=1 Tax=Motilimonas sp. E26 TaxID=2865674 RepID=UPI001E32D10E|nr:hypothetical protein [Motilimonas sp. E26]MCE0555948.1 hypothetical protein [Motilimonas sp. E26]